MNDSTKSLYAHWSILRVGIPAAAVLLPPIVFSTRATSTMLPKATLLFVLASLTVALYTAESIRRRAIALPWGLPGVALLILAIALALAAFLAPVPFAAWMGPPTRSAGFAVYVSCLVIFSIVVLSSNGPAARGVLVAGLVATGVTTLVGLGQLTAIDLGPLQPAGSSPTALLGNTNFSSALLGMGVPIALWGVLQVRWTKAARGASATIALAAFAVAWLSGAIQGPIVAVAGTSVVAAAVVLERSAHPFRFIAAGGATLASGALFLVWALAAQAGPLAGFASRASIGPRLWYWQAAWEMFASHPVSGVGLGMYPGNYTIFRSIESVRDLPEGITADSAHSVPLSMFAEGGFLLGGAYLFFLAVVGYLLLKELLKSKGENRLLIGAVGGVWFAYQVQSLVSIEVPGLMPWNYVFGGLVVALSPGTTIREFPAGRNAGARRRKKTSPTEMVGSVVGLATAFVLLWISLLPLRADEAYGRGLALNDALARQEVAPGEPVAAFDEAIGLLPQNPTYWSNLGVSLGAAGDIEGALDSLSEAVARHPYNRSAVGTAARNHSVFGEPGVAEMYWQRLIELDRYRVSYLIEASEFYLQHERDEDAAALLRQALRVDPQRTQARELLSGLE